MKRAIIITLMLTTVFSVFADMGRDKGKRDGGTDVFQSEYQAFLDEHRDTAISDLTFGDIEEHMTRISVPMQEQMYINRASSASRMTAGMGQFLTGDALSGTLFLAADLAIAAGTLVGTYFLLPAELQFDQLDYLGTPISQVKETWKTTAQNASLETVWPTLAVVAGGTILHKAITVWSARHAADVARQNIEDKTVTFEPQPTFTVTPHGKLGFGMGFRF